MTAFLRRIAFALGLQKREEDEDFDFGAWMATTYIMVPTPEYDALVADATKWRTRPNDYLADFGPNVPVEGLGGKPVGMEKAP